MNYLLKVIAYLNQKGYLLRDDNIDCFYRFNKDFGCVKVELEINIIEDRLIDLNCLLINIDLNASKLNRILNNVIKELKIIKKEIKKIKVIDFEENVDIDLPF